MKIRIFALARDLGLDSKVLIDLAEEAGVKLRNALATISEEERDQIIAYLRRKGTPGASEIPTSDITPVRETQSQAGRVRVIGASGRGTMRSADGQPDELQGGSPEGEQDDAVPVEVSDEHSEVIVAAETAVEAEPAAQMPAEPAVEEPIAEPAVSEPESAADAAVAADTEVAAEVPVAVAAEPPAVAPLGGSCFRRSSSCGTASGVCSGTCGTCC